MFANINKPLLPFVLFFLPLFASGQNFEDDMKAIVQRVGNAEAYTIQSTIRVYSKKGGALKQQLNASVTATKSAALTVMGEIEMLQTGTQVIIVDRDERIIEVENLSAAKQGKTKQKQKEALRLDNLQKLGGSGLTFKLTATSGNTRTYSASDVKAGIKSLVIKLDAVNKKMISYTLEQADSNGNTEQYVVVDYSTFTYTVEHPELLKASHFITTEGTNYQASSAFKGYSVLKK